MARYAELFSIIYQHEYFSNGGCLSMKYLPTKYTSHLLNNMGVLTRPIEGGCQFIFDVENHESAKELYLLFANESLAFMMYPEDSKNFYNYTEGFSAEKEGALLFSADKPASIDDDVVDLGYGEFTDFETNGFDAEEIVELRARKNSQIPVVFKITTDKLLAMPETAKYKLGFRSLRTHYKYYLCNYDDSDTLQIVDVENNIEFINKQEKLENGKQAQVFISTSPIMSRHNTKRHFRLMENNSGISRVVIDYMPMPKPGRYFTDQLNGDPVMVSEVFIN